ncbi:type II toxin-antitoxin system RelE/ParE family toxin [Iodobacter arcticus]|uniref:Type II toxin-antitoxin system RelE/ParE family toxin n=1 Tax=Iodobacter arcticus TaxID=590593 RepID=A0ABW2R1V0_9NEIS
MRLELTQQALSDMQSHAVQYQQQAPELTERFLAELMHGFKLIESIPTAFQLIDETRRRYVVRGFPFLLLYRVDMVNEVVYLLRVYHQRQSYH